MAEIDFITALGRLLRDGNLRDVYAAQPDTVAARLDLRPEDRPAFRQLVPEDVEFQARILLRKRFDLVRRFLPDTERRLGEKAWPLFLDYARVNWPAEPRATLRDAGQFCRRLRQQQPSLVSQSEWNRLRFALSEKSFAIHWQLRGEAGGTVRPRVQIFYRGRSRRWREFGIMVRL